MSKRRWLLLAPVALLSGALALSAPDDGGPSPEPAAKERLELARQTFELLATDFRDGRLDDADRLALWSRRILDAKLAMGDAKDDRIAGYRAHLGRMRDLQEIAKAMFAAGQASQANVLALRYHQSEAREWVAAEEAK